MPKSVLCKNMHKWNVPKPVYKWNCHQDLPSKWNAHIFMICQNGQSFEIVNLIMICQVNEMLTFSLIVDNFWFVNDADHESFRGARSNRSFQF